MQFDRFGKYRFAGAPGIAGEDDRSVGARVGSNAPGLQSRIRISARVWAVRMMLRLAPLRRFLFAAFHLDRKRALSVLNQIPQTVSVNAICTESDRGLLLEEIGSSYRE